MTREDGITSTSLPQTERSFLKQPKVFLSSKASARGKALGKAGTRFWKNVGLGFKTPREAVEGTYIHKKCPFTGDILIRGRILLGTVIPEVQTVCTDTIGLKEGRRCRSS